MCFVAAGADVDACDKLGNSVSKAACEADFERVWIEVLAECGYEPEPFLQYLSHHYRRENAGLGVFATTFPKVRSTRLSLAEYCDQRESLPIFNPLEGTKYYEARIKRRDEWKEFLKLVEEESEDEDNDSYDGEADIYSTEHGAEWWLL
jgi:hypothetical protein